MRETFTVFLALNADEAVDAYVRACREADPELLPVARPIAMLPDDVLGLQFSKVTLYIYIYRYIYIYIYIYISCIDQVAHYAWKSTSDESCENSAQQVICVSFKSDQGLCTVLQSLNVIWRSYFYFAVLIFLLLGLILIMIMMLIIIIIILITHIKIN